jgi:cobalamin biosynthesis Mg chelatase CobN
LTSGAPRAARIVVLAVALLVAVATLMPSPIAAAAPVQDCSTTTLLEPCGTSTSVDQEPEPTTTTVDETPTTSDEETTTTEEAEATTTSRQGSATTAEEVLETTTTLTVTTGSNLLVPGDGTEGAESTTTTLERPTTVEDGGLSDGTLIGLVIVGLVLIAVVVSVLTWRYWVATRPPLRETAPDTEASPVG